MMPHKKDCGCLLCHPGLRPPQPPSKLDLALAKIARLKSDVKQLNNGLKRKTKRVEELESRLEALLRNRPCNPSCDSFSHAPKDQNHDFGSCPCVKRWHDAMDLASTTLKKP